MSSSDRPYFTVIMATYNRGRHIVPSVRSVLAQTLGDFELLVVGDNCTDDTGRVVSAFGSRQVRWLNLDRRGGSQSFPNNAGIAQARGKAVAYIGHDDIWARDHLERLAAVFDSRPDVDFAVSGGIYHLPNSIPGSSVTGLFDADSAKHDHFFPPSTFAHRRNVCDRIGHWLPPADTQAPVDAHFLGRAAGADLQFASTGKVTVHKFAAGHRYLSYILQESDEQEAMLARLNDPDYDRFVGTIVSEAKAAGKFMVTLRQRYFQKFAPGELARANATQKGLLPPDLKPVGCGATIRQEPSDCALDWQREPQEGIRWSARNPRPRVLLPFTSRRPIRLQMEIAHSVAGALGEVRLACNGKPTVVRPGVPMLRNGVWVAQMEVVVDLKRNDYSILELHLTDTQAPAPNRHGIGIGDISLLPIRPSWRNVLSILQANLRGAASLAKTLS